MVGMLYEGKYVYLCFVGLDFNVNRFLYILRVFVISY